MADELKVPHYVKKALGKLRSRTLICQASATEEAISKGDGHLFFTHPDGRPFPTASAVFSIRNGLVAPLGDGLFDTGSQSYRLSAHGESVIAA